MLIHITGSGNSSLETILADDVQPNAVDLRIKDIWAMSGTFTLTVDGKIHREKTLLKPDEDGFYNIGNGAYEISFDNTVTMAADEAGFVITRSTLNRNGIFITSGLYDSGYKGSLAACLHNNGGPARIEVGSRLAQFLLFKAEALKMYDGSYGFDANGNLKPEELQYYGGKIQ